jgi:endoglucanase
VAGRPLSVDADGARESLCCNAGAVHAAVFINPHGRGGIMNRAREWARLCAVIVIATSASARADVAPLSVSGNQIRAGGQPASFAGNSLFWSNTGWGGEKYYNANVVRWLKTDWKSTIVRAAMGVEDSGGFLQDPNGNRARVRAVVDAAIANDLYVIIDWHSHHAESYRSNAIAFFQDMARTYGTRNHVIYEIYNEPLQVSWSGTIKPYAQAVISAIRAIDPDNLIVVGTPTWSQDVDVAAADPIAGTNIAYTLHFYAGTHGQFLRDKAQTALNRGAALFVTEWGSVNANGDGGVNTSETNAWMNFLKARGISHANWATNDKAEGASALVPGASTAGGWSASQLTASGTLAKQIISGWGGTTPPPGGNVIATIQAESFSQQSGIQTENTTDAGGGLNVGWIDVNDWLSYQNSPVTIPATGAYRIEYRVASLNGGGGLRLEAAGGSPVHGQLAVPGTGGWQNWTTISHTVNLTAGTHRFGIAAVSGGWNLNWFRIVRL